MSILSQFLVVAKKSFFFTNSWDLQNASNLNLTLHSKDHVAGNQCTSVFCLIFLYFQKNIQ